MTARGRAYASHTGAALCLAAGLAACPWNALYAIPGILAAALLVWAGVGYWDTHRDALARHEQARRAALLDPRPHTDGAPLTGHEAAAWVRLVATYQLPDRDPRSTP
ncbi:hypothetical protein QD712_25685 [Streptomyces acidiscabies]|uniref:hypothetical protein n=1 Tax=Streptomyces acidiscabies TaxID=42234 RepID=UPI0030CE5AF6